MADLRAKEPAICHGKDVELVIRGADLDPRGRRHGSLRFIVSANSLGRKRGIVQSHLVDQSVERPLPAATYADPISNREFDGWIYGPRHRRLNIDIYGGGIDDGSAVEASVEINRDCS